MINKNLLNRINFIIPSGDQHWILNILFLHISECDIYHFLAIIDKKALLIIIFED